MEMVDFQDCVNRYFAAYFSRIEVDHSLLGRGPWIFPTEIVTGEFDGTFAFELVGAAVGYQGLRVSRTRASSLGTYLWQFPAQTSTESHAPLISLRGVRDSGLRDVVLTAGDRVESIRNRYPGLRRLVDGYESALRHSEDSQGPLIDIADVDNCTLQNVLIFNEDAGVVRLRNILLASFYDSRQTRRGFLSQLRRSFPLDGQEVSGVIGTPSADITQILQAAQFVNRLLTPGHIEVDLSAFLRAHESLLCRAFGYSRVLYEPLLSWQVSPPDPTVTSYNPDFMGKRADGYWDLLELKLPLLDSSRLITGKGAYTRFLGPVQKAVAQLAHYEHYFTYPDNAAWAREKYGVQVKGPRRVAIVGTSENADSDEIRRALLTAPAGTEIVDYDSLVHLSLA